MFDLYLITDAQLADLPAAVEAALLHAPAGRVAVQLRAKQRSSRELLELARRLRRITHARGAALYINDRCDIACSVHADGVHLPEQGLPIDSARLLLPAAMQIGVSCHDAVSLRRAAEQGANFATLSPVFDSPGKGPALGCVRFAEATRQTALRVYALGGVRADHAASLRASGAAGLAVISAVFGAADASAAIASCLGAWDAAATGQPKD